MYDWQNDRQFDKQFNRTWRSMIAVWAVLLILDLAILAGIIFVVIHFLQKVW